MRDKREYDAIVVVTPADFTRLKSQHRRIVELLPARRVFFVGSKEVGTLLDQEIREGVFSEGLKDHVGFLLENDVLPFDEVQDVMNRIGGPLCSSGQVPRNFTGWYYQQFIKLAYADYCRDEYYMAWDGDTIPCKEFSMFSENDIPYLDYKREYHAEYFTTMKTLLGLFKVIEPSFISEHMLFQCSLVQDMRRWIETNANIKGESWWEKILYAIRPEKLLDNSFSEFETYGTYVALTSPSAYRLREWHSFRYAAEFFEVDRISDQDYIWLGHDFSAVSFEKNMRVREDHRKLFDNPEYQRKMSARKMLEVAQEVFEGGYIEKWDIPQEETTETGRNETGTETKERSNGERGYLPADSWREYEQLGDRLSEHNVNQAYLCYENAEYLAADEEEKYGLAEKKGKLMAEGRVSVRKTCILILSYNQKYLMEKCLESIDANCNHETISLVVFDNASTDGVRDQLMKYVEDRDDCTLVLSEKNLGFPAGCNAAASYAPQDQDLLLLNNDTRLPANALFWLRMALYDTEDIGAVGAVQNYDSTKDQFIDVEFPFPEQYMEYGAQHNKYMEHPCEEKKKLSGFAMLIRGGLFHQLGGFDEQFSPGYYEDDDLCVRIREQGYRLVVCKNAFIYHAGSQSFVKSKDVYELIERNRKRFIAKWGNCL